MAGSKSEEAESEGERVRSIETQLRQKAIASRLFDEDATVKVARFTILERLGMGAMGAVYRAYDPSLDRAVALKVLHPSVMAAAAEAEVTMRREAKALARLSHPNVVTVHEVGGDAGRIWIAMELVEGGTLEARLRSLDAGEHFDWVVKVMLQAGEGLAAAHEAGVIHRDFKPANVMVGTDERVRVADFGLASVPREGAETSVGVGTPAYMPPEQWDSQVDATADQYAYCLVFWESLFGFRPERLGREPSSPEGADPRAAQLAQVLAQGLREDASARHPSMRALLDATRDVVFERPRQRQQARRRVGVVAGLIGTAVVASVLSSGASEEACSGAIDRLNVFWPGAERDAAFDALDALDAAYAERAVPRVREVAEAFGQAWGTAYRSTCLAHARQEQSDYVFERRMSCLEQAGAAYASLAERVADPQTDVAALVTAAAGLPDPDGCGALQPLPVEARPPAELQEEIDAIDTLRVRARTFLDAGAPLRAVALTHDAVEQARGLGYGPVMARALHERGRIRTIVGELPELDASQAMKDLGEAAELAMLDKRYGLAVEAWARWAWLRGTVGGDTDVLIEDARVMAAIIGGAAPGSAAEALLHNNVGGVFLARSEREKARESFQRSLQIAQGLPRHDAELNNAGINLALVTEDNDARDALFERLVRDERARLGPEHPRVLQILLLYAATTASGERARDTFRDLAGRYAQFHEELRPRRAEVYQELAWWGLRSHSMAEAAENFEAFAELEASDPVALEVARAYAALARADTTTARAMLAMVAERPLGSAWQRGNHAHALLGLAIMDDDLDRFRAAAGAFAELAHLPTAALALRLEFALKEMPHVPELTGALERAVEGWRAGRVTREEIDAALRRAASTTG